MSDNIALEKVYEPVSVERDVTELWDREKAFDADPGDVGKDKSFVVMIPLPNVTGSLHLGHAINNTLQDIMTRWHRMRGFRALYQPGTDHAGIATQAVVERRIFEEEGKTRHDIGRDELVRRIWEWKKDYEQRILGQLKRMGCSCDWRRVRFTLDDKYTDSVHETFFRWFADGLVYRGERLVNWDTHLRTAVADDEVYHDKIQGHFWHFKYPLKDAPAGGPTHLGFATTRPETMLGDVALAVNPEDDRYKALVGKTVLLPLFDPPREMPIIADEWADPEKGTGCVKITPAHDPNDYEVGLRNDLPMLNIMTPEGKVNEQGGKYAGLTFPEARKAVVADMEAMDLLEKVEDLEVDLPCSDRSKTPIEPYLSPQWFVRMGDVAEKIKLADGARVPGLAQAAIDAVDDERVKIFPNRYRKTYKDWLGEKRDWCISRQLWWGHQIPVWSRQMSGREFVQWFKDESAKPALLIGNMCPDLATCVVTASGENYQIAGTEDAYEQLHRLDEDVPDVDELCTCYVCIRREDALVPDGDAASGETLIAWLERNGFERDPDVLDTWFSSQLWPFATLGWPEETKDLEFFYPGSVLITGRDIITLWVARMVLSGLYLRGQVPFDDVYIHPKILDGRGDTMSKSKGNGVDPMDIIQTHGADALRYTMADMCTETQDIRMPVEYICPHCGGLVDQAAALKVEAQRRKSRGEKLLDKLRPSDVQRVDCTSCQKEFATRWAKEAVQKELTVAVETSDKFDIGRNFCNKLWNAARFAFMNIEGVGCEPIDVSTLPTEDKWILAQLSHTSKRLHEELGKYHYAIAIKLLRDFFWDALCDWYIELTKARMRDGEKGAEAKQILAFCLDQVLRMFHPFMPYITERLWSQLNALAPTRGLPGLAEPAASDLLVKAEFPPAEGWTTLADEGIVHVFAELQEVTRAVRDLKNKNGVATKDVVDVTVIAPAADVDALTAQASIVQRLANVGTMSVASEAERPANSGTAVVGAMRVYVHGISDDAKEIARLEKEISSVGKQIDGKERKLANEGFVSKASPEIVQAERDRLASLLDQRGALEESLSLLR